MRRLDRPVYYALGGLSNPDLYGEIAERLSHVFDDFILEVFEERHHVDPPHRIEPERLAGSLSTVDPSHAGWPGPTRQIAVVKGFREPGTDQRRHLGWTVIHGKN